MGTGVHVGASSPGRLSLAGGRVPLTARTPRALFRTCQDHCNQILNKVLTQYRLRFSVRHATHARTLLAFFNGQGETVAVPLSPTPWYLFIGQHLQAVPEGSQYTLSILEYQYRIQRTPLIDDEAEVRFEYVSPAIDSAFPYSRHHVQFHQDYHEVREGFSLQRLHIPTGEITIAHVIRFLIADLGVPPLTEQWKEELRASEERMQGWMD